MDAIIDRDGLGSLELLRELIRHRDTSEGDSIYSMIESAMRDVRIKFLSNEWGKEMEVERRREESQVDGGEEKSEFPVNIREIIQRAGIQLYETNMNADIGFQFEKVNGHVRRQENGKWAIYVENDESECSKRYIMAHEFCRLLIQEMEEAEVQSTEGKVMRYCIDPLFPKNKYELYADMMTAFLMFPYESVLGCMEDYAEELRRENTYPMDAFEWTRVLGQYAQISSYYTIISYQYLKYFLCGHYSETSDDGFKQKYDRFFR